MWMINNKNIIKLKNINEIDVMIILEILWMNNEQYFMDYQRLIIEHFYATFRKALKCEMIIY